MSNFMQLSISSESAQNCQPIKEAWSLELKQLKNFIFIYSSSEQLQFKANPYSFR